MKRYDLLKYLDSIASFDAGVKRDNIGQIIKGPEDIDSVMVCLDITKDSVDYAIRHNVDYIITHHPAIYEPLYSIENDLLLDIIRNNMGVISSHTNYDAARLNNVLADLCNLTDIQEIFFEDNISLGRKGKVVEQKTQDYIDFLKEKFELKYLKTTGILPKTISTAAVGTGASNAFFEELRYLDVDIFITGELKYDLSKSLDDKSPLVVELGHYESEECFVDDLSVLLKKEYPDLNVLPFKKRVHNYL